MKLSLALIQRMVNVLVFIRNLKNQSTKCSCACFRALLSKTDTSQTISVCRILEPVNMKLTIIRNLAALWYTNQPEADITCELPAVKVTR